MLSVPSTVQQFCSVHQKKKSSRRKLQKNKVNGQKSQAAVNPRGISIHINTDHRGSIHEKRLYDVSGLPEFLKITRGKQTIILPVIADRGYVGIESYHKSVIVQQRVSKKETINRNNNIAFERFFGRFKGIRGNYERRLPQRPESSPSVNSHISCSY